jgi:hypothetical protein
MCRDIDTECLARGTINFAKRTRAYDSFRDVSFDNGIIGSPSHLSVHDASSCICGPSQQIDGPLCTH